MLPEAQLGDERVRVLLVEDELFIRLDLAEHLRDLGFEVVEAGSADDAMEYLASGERIEALVTDIRMPGTLNGLDLAAVVRAEQPNLPIVVASGSVAMEGAASRVGKFVSKPYDPKFLAMLIAEMLGSAL